MSLCIIGLGSSVGICFGELEGDNIGVGVGLGMGSVVGVAVGVIVGFGVGRWDGVVVGDGLLIGEGVFSSSLSTVKLTVWLLSIEYGSVPGLG